VTCCKVVRLALSAALLAAATVFAGCEHRAQTTAPNAVTQIAWFNGSMEEALAAAQAQNRPLLVYWGALWCPYCQALKKSVFTRADFIEKTKLFIPVYLDGDLPGAQAWGEKLKVSGYPTVLVLRPNRTEVARLSGGMDLSLYASLIDDAVRDERPIRAVFASTYGAEDCHRLAYYGWDPDALEAMDAARLANTLTTSAARCRGSEQVRLEVLALSFAFHSKGESAGAKERVQALLARLGHPDEVRNSIDLLVGLDESLYTVVSGLGDNFAAEFQDRYVTRMQEAADSARFGESDRLIALASALDATKALSPTHAIPADMQAAARTRVRAALTPDGDRFARGDLVNGARILLEVLGDDAAAHDLLVQELPNTKTPYYYMSHLATLAEKHGKPEQALDWQARAYAATQGSATRVRWGGSYVRALIRLTPDDTQRIRAAALQVASEVTVAEAVQGRSRAALARIQTALEQWATTPQRRAVAVEVASHLPSVTGSAASGG
jgi:protein disulfide-isomerase